jgi:phosphate transport system permease protein
LLSTTIAIIALTALLYNIINSAFGLVAVQNENTPSSLVLTLHEDKLLASQNLVASEDDNELAAEIAADRDAIGFLGYAYLQENSDTLKAIPLNGVAPTAETVNNDEYPLTRPLFIYTTADILAEKPEVAAFVSYYLSNVNQEIDEVGYFPVDQAALDEAQGILAEEAGLPSLPGVSSFADRDIVIAGSSTVFPLTARLIEGFEASGYGGNVSNESIGSSAGLRRFCIDGTTDIANSSRPINQAEFEACRKNGRDPVEIRVGTDALAVVVSQENDFVNNLTLDELRLTFSTAENWSQINDAWPAEPINRFIPGADSGTLDFFTEAVFDQELNDLSKEELVEILGAYISVGAGRRLERDQRFFEDRLAFESQELWDEVCASDEPATGCTLPARDAESVYDLVLARVVVPDVQQTWTLFNSIFNRSDILAEAAIKHPNAEVEFRSWITADFISDPQSSEPELAGVRTAIFGSIWVIAVTIAVAFPLGVGAAIYLEEYADQTKRINQIIQTNINNLAGVPSIIYGMLGLAIFVRALEVFTSGSMIGGAVDSSTANGRTIISAGMTLALLILPIIIIGSQEAIRAVPSSLRQASLGLGATKWQTIWNHVLPNAIPSILTATILAMSRAIGETAPLVVVGASTFITVDPSGPFSKFTVLPIQIYQWTSRPQAEFRNIAAAAIIVLLGLLLSLNATAIILRNRFSKQRI